MKGEDKILIRNAASDVQLNFCINAIKLFKKQNSKNGEKKLYRLSKNNYVCVYRYEKLIVAYYKKIIE